LEEDEETSRADVSSRVGASLVDDALVEASDGEELGEVGLGGARMPTVGIKSEPSFKTTRRWYRWLSLPASFSPAVVVVSAEATTPAATMAA
jgi:hypothetical protein